MTILIPFSWLYAFIISIRNFCYDIGLFKSVKVSVPVISVGNITAGGTGKTPFVEYLIRYFLSRGKKISVVSRGYKRKSKGFQLVSDGNSVYGNAVTMGDEPFQIAQKFPGVIVVVVRNRVRGAKMVIDQFKPDLILLDDGFQHRGIVRDLNFVMIDSKKPLSELPMIPAGLRREPISALKRADFIVLTNNPRLFERKEIESRNYYKMPVAKLQYNVIGLRELRAMNKVNLRPSEKKKCIAFCGIGNPSSFEESLNENGFDVDELVVFRDHHQYDLNDLNKINNLYHDHKVNYIITTEKDAVRLKSILFPQWFPIESLYFVEIEPTIIEGEKELHVLLDKTIMEAT